MVEKYLQLSYLLDNIIHPLYLILIAFLNLFFRQSFLLHNLIWFSILWNVLEGGSVKCVDADDSAEFGDTPQLAEQVTKLLPTQI